MSILIKGMKMPGVCYECDFCNYGFCSQRERYVTAIQDRDADCPLIELPPHGRLIDADELEVCDGWLREAEEYSTHITFVYSNDIDNAPTVVPAEEAQE